MWLNRPMMIEQRSFDLLSLHAEKHPTFKNIKHVIRNSKKGIKVHGILTKNSEAFDDILGMTPYEKIREEIEEALIDEEVETIILDIDSPGGEVNGLFDLSDFIYKARKLKKIIAMTNDDAYSAAYAIASSAEKVLVTRTSGVGSIGVIASHIDQSGFDEKQGIKYTTVFAGKRKNDLNPHEPITSESLESLQKEVDRLYEMFVQLIARDRNLFTERIKSTEAGLYFGERAIEIGLADGITTFSEFIDNYRSNSMNKVEIKEQAIDIDDLIEQGRCLGYESCRKEVLEVIRLCNLSKMPEKIGEFIEQDVNAKQAQEILMSILAERTKKTEILSTIPQSSSEDLMMQVAKARQNSQL
ncbi:S49 family peptidase [Wolbachia endosymbiont of Drosophila pseudotakahashii]|uniref:S49 family peptidase n=1 Tax=Wolbachia endosymbiont of Drosophila pseudotakahashii TaxID=375919 RepID=UPI00224EBC46|nr:S49 family peptidase [Wolbachia endosymbiont of Drosophila pseudotakahashii]MCX3065199.1 S49 family peptidase [Wolbachia endosymbiont of Drosophila pseudotakahashii]